MAISIQKGSGAGTHSCNLRQAADLRKNPKVELWVLCTVPDRAIRTWATGLVRQAGNGSCRRCWSAVFLVLPATLSAWHRKLAAKELRHERPA
jgi:hypothetical protein